jgi:hypothetical protein
MSKRKQPPQPEDLLFMLVDSVMARLSPNTWKVVSYIASQHMRVQEEFFLRRANIAVFYLNRDIKQATGIDMDTVAVNGEQRPYRQGGPALPCACWIHDPPRFAVLSLSQICSGVRVKDRWQDHGTGLTKSSVAKALKEAIAAGIVIRERRKGSTGVDGASKYAIDWDKVQEVDWARRKMEKVKKRRRKKPGLSVHRMDTRAIAKKRPSGSPKSMTIRMSLRLPPTQPPA